MGKPPPLFQAFRALGYITDSVPFAVQRRGKETFVTVSVGKTWQVYNCGKLTLVLVGPQLHGNIRALAAKGDLTFAAVGNSIVVCKRVHKAAMCMGHTGDVVQLMPLGEQLLSLGADGQLLVWHIGQWDKPQMSVQLPPNFQPSCMAHPDTYLNKVVIGSTGGQLLLVNFASGKVLYTFQGWGAAVRAVVASPALDVVGCALADGRAALLNLKFDETLAVFSNAAGVGLSSGLLLTGSDPTATHAAGGGAAAGLGACTCLAFRTGAGIPLMAAGGGAGVVTVWDLEQRKLHTVIQDAHDAPLVALHFFAGEPLLMSAGADNALKHWLFDAAQPQPRLLRFRSGHAAPPTVVMHYGEGLRLLSAGADRAFRVFSTIQDQQSRELSQKHIARRAKRLKVREVELKLARVVAMDAATVRERDWANVITAHEGDPTAYVWRLAHFTLGEHELQPPQHNSPAGTNSKSSQQPGGRTGAPVTAVALSSCGNFGIVGSAAGRVDRYNMQSGLHRGVYSRPAPSSQSQQPAAGAGRPGQQQQQQQPALAAHDASVTGLCVDSCNKLLVSTGLDGQLRVWDFKKQRCECSVAVGSPVTHLAHTAGSSLVAVAADDLLLRCYDVEAGGRLVRRFKGHRDRITCLQLSSDGRWLLSSSMDGTLRVWDVPAAQCLQVLRLGAPITAFSLPPAQDLLATCHVNRRGVYLWSNQAVFGDPGQFTPSEQPVDVSLPTVSQADLGDAAGSNLAAAAPRAPRVRIAGSGDVQGDSKEDHASSEDESEEGEPGGMEVDTGAASEEDEGYSEPEPDQDQHAAAAAAATAAEQPPAWQQQDQGTGAPAPLAPSLVTLSLLPRAQWHSLMHLDAIKARNKPIQPAKKPEAAPFFLPTVAGLSGNPTFDPAAAAAAQADADGEEGAAGSAPGAGGSRVLRGADPTARAEAAGGAAAAASEFLRLLRAGADAGDWSSFMAYMRGLSPVALDREVRALQLLTDAEDEDEDGVTAAAVHDLASLLEAIDAQLAAGVNFEFCAALLQLVLRVHGDAVMAQRFLRGVAQRVHKRLRPVWGRLDGLLADVRCMTAYFGNLQG